ncbi:MAG: sulfotransferase [Bacteroidota bacterium]
MLLDHLLFPGFRKQSIKNAVFIVAAPRSATTYLFHLLASEKEIFTTFKLWEIVFAPGISQKYLLLAIIRFDRSIGNPLRKMVLKIERKIFGNFTHIHKISLTLPEEDEAILLWNMSTVYLNFFFPDTPHFDAYFLFDDCLPLTKQHRIMNYYYRCVQRHNYVFNRSGNRRFLSKNPAMMSKVKSMHGFFPDATILNINRSPAKTIPSTIALNNNIYKFFTSVKASEYINNKTRQILINWYKMANNNISKYYAGNYAEIDFDHLVKGEQRTIEMICKKLGIDLNTFHKDQLQQVEASNHISKNKYASLAPEDIEQIRIELPFLSKYML